MTTTIQPGIEVKDGEKISHIIAYTNAAMVWGAVATREAVRVSTWLRTQSAPDYMPFQRAQVLMTNNPESRPQAFEELYVPVGLVQAYHLQPPAHDPLDYDPNEPNRKLEPVTALVGPFRFDGFVRLSTMTNLSRYLDVNTETYTSIYDVSISLPGSSKITGLQVPFLLVRRESALFSPRKL